MDVTFTLGDAFSSFADVKKRIDEYSRKKYVDFYVRDCRTIASALNTKRMSRSISEDKKSLLRYFEVKFACVHGGRKHKSRATGKRASHTFRKDCPCVISFRLDDEGNNLIVTTVNLEHANHEIDENSYNFYPKVRKLSADEKT